jgi:hypothetical protein
MVTGLWRILEVNGGAENRISTGNSMPILQSSSFFKVLKIEALRNRDEIS